MKRNKIRICFPFVGDTVGGSHISTLILVKKLLNGDYEPIVVLFEEGSLANYLNTNDMPYCLIPSKRYVRCGSIISECIQMCRHAFSLSVFLRKKHISIVHANDLRMLLTWGLPAWIAGCKFIWQQRTINDSRRNDIYSRFADVIITISEFCKSKLSPTMSKRAKVIYNPFDETGYYSMRSTAKTNLLDELRVDGRCKIIGFVGNLTEQKRPEIFVRAAKEIMDNANEMIIFVMFGDKRKVVTEKVTSLIDSLGMNDHIYLLGLRHPIEPFIAACDILLAPGVNEGFGRTLVEAMLVGTVVVASDSGGHKEIIGNNKIGYLIEPDNPKVLADKVSEMLNSNYDLTEVTKRAFEYTKTNFTSTIHATKMSSIYKQLVG